MLATCRGIKMQSSSVEDGLTIACRLEGQNDLELDDILKNADILLQEAGGAGVGSVEIVDPHATTSRMFFDSIPPG